MSGSNFSTAFTVDQTPAEVFAAINNVRGWWSEEIEGCTDTCEAEFSYRFKDIHHADIKLTELIPGKKIVWLVLDNYFSFTEDKSEWTGTEIIFDISRKDGQTEVRFTHLGLVETISASMFVQTHGARTSTEVFGT